MSGAVASVDSTGKIVSLTDGDGKLRWSVDVIHGTEKHLADSACVRSVGFDHGQVMVVFGKHSFASIDPATRKVTYLGSD